MKKSCGFAFCTALAFSLALAASAQGQNLNQDGEIPVPVIVPDSILVECQIDLTEATEPKNPYKKKDGWWDQGSVGACLWTSLVNANIKAGADDTGGKFARRFRRCLAREGYPNAWRRGNTTVPSPAYTAMLACKKEARATESVEVEFKVLPSTDPWTDRKAAIKKAIDADGAATVITVSTGDPSHSSSVESIDCAAGTITVRDPNGGTNTLTVDADGNVTNVSPADDIYEGSTMDAVTVECKTA